MPITPINTPAKLNQQTGMVLAYFGYDRTTTPTVELKATLCNSGWMTIDDDRNTGTKLNTAI